MSRNMDTSKMEEYRPHIMSASKAIFEELTQNPIVTVFDEIKSQIGDLIKLRNPQKQYDKQSLSAAIEEHLDGQSPDLYGNWVYYPWRSMWVHILPEEEFIAVRTVRNKYVITEEEQALLRTKKVGVIGLSVGQSVALTLAMERGCGEIRLADFDTLELSNLNRIRSGVHNLGVRKSVLTAREIAEIDPYLNVVLYNEGVNDENIDEFFEKGGQLDLLIEECDAIDIKIKSRLKAKKLNVPVIMDTSDRGMIDIERFDLEPERPIFHGFLDKFGNEADLVSKLSIHRKEILMSLLDFDNLSNRGKQSMLEIGKTLTTWPQVASSVILGGGASGYFSRLILLGQGLQSDRYYIDLEKIAKFEYGS